jgi:carboxypeptidase C (cathepsin A)
MHERQTAPGCGRRRAGRRAATCLLAAAGSVTGLALAAAPAMLPTAAVAELADPPQRVVTHHSIHLGNATLGYTAEAGRIAIRDVETGAPHGFMFYTAYHVDGRDSAFRPVTFIWNGGPGADSALLHFSVAGPELTRDGHLVENPDTWLAVSDLVMVDPVGTGFSRPVSAEYAAEFYGTKGDVASVTEFVRSWRLLHGAEDSRVFLVGESWGARRAASVGCALEKRGVPVGGLVLISGGWGLNKSYGPATLHDALRVVDMASAALFHGKTAPELGTQREALRQAAEQWARATYAPALARLGELSDGERAALAAGLARFTGIPADAIDPHKLTISPRQFRELLLKGSGEVLSPFDLRVVGEQHLTGSTAAILGYLRHDLGYRTDLPYVGLEPLTQGFAPNGTYPQSVGERWNYATIEPTAEQLKAALETASREGGGPPQIGPPLPATEDALAQNPQLKILVAAGMYDGFQPCASGAETYAELPADMRAAIRFRCYVGGHAMYLDSATRTELSRDVRTLISAQH